MAPSSDPIFPFLKNLDIPPGWESAAQQFLEQDGIALVLGGPDTGKSTLCSYLVYRAYVTGKPVALVDLDLGQSHLGPPGALGLGLFPPRFPGEQSLFPEALYFIGQTSPVGAVFQVAVGCRVLVNEAQARGVHRVVVNTSGLIHGLAAYRLKQAEVELLQPNLLLALAREEELTSLLRLLDYGSRTLSMPVSSRAVRRGLDWRRQYRESRFRRYFDQAQRLDLSLAQVVWQGPPLGWGEPLSPGDLDHWSKILGDQVLYGVAGDSRVVLLLDRPPATMPSGEFEERLHLLSSSDLEHLLVGLWDKGHRTVALGLLLPSPWQEGILRFLTPWPASQIHQVRSLSLGRLKLSPTGRELTASTLVK
jgi:polynucleotide 5'-hydroxyl-kinase GRC3/NOL9